MVLQIALVCEGIQCWAGTTVLDVSAKVIVVGLAIAQRLLVSLATSEEAFDEVNEPHMHLVVELGSGMMVRERMTERSLVERPQPASTLTSSDLEETKAMTFCHMPNDIRLRMYPLEAFIMSHQGKLQLPAEGFSFPEAGRV